MFIPIKSELLRKTISPFVDSYSATFLLGTICQDVHLTIVLQSSHGDTNMNTPRDTAGHAHITFQSRTINDLSVYRLDHMDEAAA
jgi:hypothetical protein